MIYAVNAGGISPVNISIRCHNCRQRGTFHPFGNFNDLIIADRRNTFVPDGQVVCGQRQCPNPECFAHVFVVYTPQQKRLLACYPAERIDFDTTNIPPSITNALTEAITCHANQCYIAAAIMVRKSLEELCRVQEATGNNLKARIASLGTKVMLPKELLDGLDDLRLLGNDAAHIESQEFNTVGQEEAEIGIEFVKEVLKAVYQYTALLGRLRSLKKD